MRKPFCWPTMLKSERIAQLVFLCVLVLSILDRSFLLRITSGFASDDLTVIWLAAKDYSRSIFHEPFFYGQNYGVMLEAFLVAPFVAFGADPIIAVPIMIVFIAIIPFWSFAFYHFIQKEYVPAVTFLAIPMLLPPEHGLQYTNLNGLAVLALYPWLSVIRSANLRSFLTGLVLCMAAAINLNALVACAAFGTWFLYSNITNYRRLIWAVLGASPVIIAFWAAIRFYDEQPEAIMNSIFGWNFVFHPELILEAIMHLDDHFAWLCPYFWQNGHLVLWMILFVGIVLFRTDHKSTAIGLFVSLLVTILALGLAITYDGTDSIFFPLSRMFLAIPLVLGWGLSELRLSIDRQAKALIYLGVTVVLGFAVRTITAPAKHSSALADQSKLPLCVWSITKIREQCKILQETAFQRNADAIVLLRDPDHVYAQFMTMGCPVCEENIPPTYMPGGDRRHWRRIEEATLNRRALLVVNGSPAMLNMAMTGDPTIELIRRSEPELRLIHDPGSPIDSLMDLWRTDNK